MIIVLMGVTGTGKTTVGRVLAEELGWTFRDGDDFHPAANIEKMRRGEPLNDDDRAPWLAALGRLIDDTVARVDNLVLACSALEHRYQDYLRHDLEAVHYVELWGTPELIEKRLAARKGHFMNPSLLPSQFAILEPPADAIRVEVSRTPNEITAEIRGKLGV